MGKRTLNKKDLIAISAAVLIGFVVMLFATGVMAILFLGGNYTIQVLLPTYLAILLSSVIAWIITKNWIVFAIVAFILYLLSILILGR